MQRYIVRDNWDRVDYGGGIACCVFLIFIPIIFFEWAPLLWWLWLFILIPIGGWGSGRVYYKYAPVKTVKTVTTFNPSSSREGRDIFEDIEMTELKF